MEILKKKKSVKSELKEDELIIQNGISLEVKELLYYFLQK